MATVFPLIPRRRVLGLAFGGVRSARRGIGSDVASTREYRPGDDVGWMDWAASARLSAARGSDEFIVRERFADEAPRVVVLVDRQPSMSITASRFRSLDKPRAILTALDLIGASAIAARSLTGYLDYAAGEPYWRPPSLLISMVQLASGWEPLAPFQSRQRLPSHLQAGWRSFAVPKLSLPRYRCSTGWQSS